MVTHVASAWPHDRIDPALNAAILAWDAHALPLTQAWWDAPIFWPSHGALALSEHLLGISVLTTPLQWGGLSPLTAYNVALLISFPLTALAAHALVFACVKRHDAALLGGCIFGFNPYRMAQLAHLQMLWAFGMPLALMALHQFVERRDRQWLVLFGLAWLAQASFNGYYMLFLPILLAAWTLWFAREPHRLGAIAATWIAATIPLAPLLMVYARLHAASGMSRTINEIEFFSADVLSLFAASPLMIVWHRLSEGPTHQEHELFPGVFAAMLAVVAAGVALGRRRDPGAPDSRAWRVASRTALVLSALFFAAAASVLVLGPWKWTIGSVSVASIGAADKPLSLAAALLALAIFSARTFRSVWQRRSVFSVLPGRRGGDADPQLRPATDDHRRALFLPRAVLLGCCSCPGFRSCECRRGSQCCSCCASRRRRRSDSIA